MSWRVVQDVERIVRDTVPDLPPIKIAPISIMDIRSFFRNRIGGIYNASNDEIVIYYHTIMQTYGKSDMPLSFFIARTILHEYYHGLRARRDCIQIYKSQIDKIKEEEKRAERFADKMVTKVMNKWIQKNI